MLVKVLSSISPAFLQRDVGQFIAINPRIRIISVTQVMSVLGGVYTTIIYEPERQAEP